MLAVFWCIAAQQHVTEDARLAPRFKECVALFVSLGARRTSSHQVGRYSGINAQYVTFLAAALEELGSIDRYVVDLVDALSRDLSERHL